jgi:hypothetical protein
LVVLIGFESERAEKLIAYLEPSLLTLGLGEKSQSLKPEHFTTNTEFHSRVSHFAEQITDSIELVNRFEFSCVDPISAMRDILAEAEKTLEYNIAICPLNTKPSTIGAALAALKSERIQLIYAQPVEYNVEGYSHASNYFSIFDFREMIKVVNI